MTEKEEQCWSNGNVAAWRSILATCLHNLGAEHPEAGKARWLVERTDLYLLLRRLCGEYGDNDWPDDLHLCDVIEKHLMPYLDSAKTDSGDRE